ncbi:MAG: DUF5663 domain-containing protein [Candidatus Saccharimonadales bacterium]
MLKIDDKFLQDLDLGGLPLEEKDLLISQIYEQLELRVGTRLAEGMSNQQLEEFGEFVDRDDKDAALEWLNKNFPDYPKVVEEELNSLKEELKQQSQQIKQAIASDKE